MDGSQNMTRIEFIREVARSRPARAFAIVLGVSAVVLIGPKLWAMRGLLFAFAGICGLIVAYHAAIYLLSGERQRRRQDVETQLSKSHWSYGARGLVWPGLGLIVGSAIAVGMHGGPTLAGFAVGVAFVLVGVVARRVWTKRQEKNDLAL